MASLSQDVLARVAERARDPMRRYRLAAEDGGGVTLPVEQIQQRFDDNPLGGGEAFQMMQEQMKRWGMSMPSMTFNDAGGHISASSDQPGVKPLPDPATRSSWRTLEAKLGRDIPEELMRLYTIADGGFGPGFHGLNTIRQIDSNRDDFLRRGPDYCNSVDYPPTFLPLASEERDFHYDLGSGRIISSNEYWTEEEDASADRIYQPAFDSLTAMMEEWLARP
jgi:hypothetical protein